MTKLNRKGEYFSFSSADADFIANISFRYWFIECLYWHLLVITAYPEFIRENWRTSSKSVLIISGLLMVGFTLTIVFPLLICIWNAESKRIKVVHALYRQGSKGVHKSFHSPQLIKQFKFYLQLRGKI